MAHCSPWMRASQRKNLLSGLKWAFRGFVWFRATAIQATIVLYGIMADWMLFRRRIGDRYPLWDATERSGILSRA